MISAEEQRLIDLAVAAAPPLTTAQAQLVRRVIKPEEWNEPAQSPLHVLLEREAVKRLGRAA